jgi:uncharacterized membrane protein YdjX (TVP38/TMEM64 family)
MAWLRFGFLVAFVAAGLAGVAWYGVPTEHEAAALVGGALPWSAVAAALSGGLLGLALFPRAAYAVLAGLLFGPVLGTACAMAGQLLGSGAAFGLSRLLGRDAVASAVLRRRWLDQPRLFTVVWARLLPIIPYGLVNYGFGLTSVRPATFVLGTALGILPSTIAYAALGDSVGDPNSPVFVGAVAFTVVSVLVALLLRRRLGPGRDRRPEGETAIPAGETTAP